MSQQRRLEEEAENTRLAQTERELKYEKSRIQAKRNERAMEEIVRLRLTEALANGVNEVPLSSISLRPQVFKGLAIELSKQPYIEALTQARDGPASSSHNGWIRELDVSKPSTNPSLHITPWQLTSTSLTCKRPFDGDPREWPLFIARLRH